MGGYGVQSWRRHFTPATLHPHSDLTIAVTHIVNKRVGTPQCCPGTPQCCSNQRKLGFWCTVLHITYLSLPPPNCGPLFPTYSLNLSAMGRVVACCNIGNSPKSNLLAPFDIFYSGGTSAKPSQHPRSLTMRRTIYRWAIYDEMMAMYPP